MTKWTSIRCIGGAAAIGSFVLAAFHIAWFSSPNLARESHEMETRLLEFTKVSIGTNHKKTGIDDMKPDMELLRDGNTLPEWRTEHFVWDQMVNRSKRMNQECNSIPEYLQQSRERNKYTNLSLPPFGIASDVLSEPGTTDWPVCSLPPENSCHITTFSVIFMSHTVHRLREMSGGIKKLLRENNARLQEIILVWNNHRSTLEGHVLGKSFLEDHNNPTHLLRIFFSFEEGLGNNLLNRYHPNLKPKSPAILYYDDDGPFWPGFAIESGFQLWKRSSQQQVAAMARNLVLYKKDFPNDKPPRYYTLPNEMRLPLQQKRDDELTVHLNQVLNHWHSVSPYDTDGTQRVVQILGHAARHPEFTPHCGPSTGQILMYNFYSFAHFDAHVALPSGSFLSREYLCWLWHPRFQTLRDFVLNHPTHPDDMYTSLIVSQLSGKSPRVYPFRLRFGTQRRRLKEETMLNNKTESSYAGLWTTENWGQMREEAMNTIVEYFGSLSPGSIGWCAGTEFYNEKANSCPDNQRPHAKTIPWMHEGGLGYDECPVEEGMQGN